MKKLKKITVNTPLSHCDLIRSAIGKAGGGCISGYSYCSFSINGVGRSIPSDEAKPFIGCENKLEIIEEERIETFCSIDLMMIVIKAIKEFHPYSEPVITVSDIDIY